MCKTSGIRATIRSPKLTGGGGSSNAFLEVAPLLIESLLEVNDCSIRTVNLDNCTFSVGRCFYANDRSELSTCDQYRRSTRRKSTPTAPPPNLPPDRLSLLFASPSFTIPNPRISSFIHHRAHRNDSHDHATPRNHFRCTPRMADFCCTASYCAYSMVGVYPLTWRRLTCCRRATKP